MAGCGEELELQNIPISPTNGTQWGEKVLTFHFHVIFLPFQSI